MNNLLKTAVASALALTIGGAAQAATVDLSRGVTESDSAVLIAERERVSIADFTVGADYVVNGYGFLGAGNLSVGDDFTGISQATGLTTFVGAGTYDSHLIHFDPVGVGGSDNGTFDFVGDIVAIIVSNGAGSGNNNTSPTQLLNDTDAQFGIAGATYEQTLSRRSENNDIFTLVDANTLAFNFTTNGGYNDNVRVITETAPIPLPAGGLLLLGGLGALGMARSKRRAS